MKNETNVNLKFKESSSQCFFEHHSLIMFLCLFNAFIHFTEDAHTHNDIHIHAVQIDTEHVENHC